MIAELLRAIAAIEARGKWATYYAIRKEIRWAPGGVLATLCAHPELFRRLSRFGRRRYREHWIDITEEDRARLWRP